MKDPVLVIMAAGMGSRFGGLKQIEPVDEQGHIIMDFSIYDAIRAGFKEVVFVIKRENEQIFKEAIGNRMEKHVKLHYAFQDMNDVPDDFTVPEGRVKPWGTGHAVLSVRDIVSGPFAVINADDYYGPMAFSLIYDFLLDHNKDAASSEDSTSSYIMAGYRLGNTLTENGHVSRGICETSEEGYLRSITERTYIIKTDNGAAYSEDEGRTLVPVSADATVSMNMWGFPADFLGHLDSGFKEFLECEAPADPLKAEFYLPSVVGSLIESGKAKVTVRTTDDKWYGVTYKEDKPDVVRAISQLKENGLYPEKLWE